MKKISTKSFSVVMAKNTWKRTPDASDVMALDFRGEIQK